MGRMASIDTETVTITKKRHESLLRSEKMLICLEACGVDNWEGYREAYREAYPEDCEEGDGD